MASGEKGWNDRAMEQGSEQPRRFSVELLRLRADESGTPLRTRILAGCSVGRRRRGDSTQRLTRAERIGGGEGRRRIGVKLMGNGRIIFTHSQQ